jgi:hypothetical protein
MLLQIGNHLDSLSKIPFTFVGGDSPENIETFINAVNGLDLITIGLTLYFWRVARDCFLPG